MADIKSDFGPVSVTSNGEKTTVSNNSGPVRGSVTITDTSISGKVDRHSPSGLPSVVKIA